MSVAVDTAAARAFLGQLAAHEKRREETERIADSVYNRTQEAYRWARIDERTRAFQPAGRSGNAAIYESDDLMGRRIRDQQINNSQIRRISDALVDVVVGCSMQTFADPFDPTMSFEELRAGDFEDELTYALEADDLFEEWFQDPKRFSVRGKLSGPESQRLALRECVGAGSHLALECFKPTADGDVELCYQLIEREQLDRSKDRPAGAGENKIINGIEFDQYDREVAFHIYDDHPYDGFGLSSGSSATSKRIPANRVIHLALFQRPSDTIGGNWLASIGQDSFDRDKFIGNEIATAEKAARCLLAVFLANEARGGGTGFGLLDGTEQTDAYGNQEFRLSQSPLAFRLGKDDKVEMLESGRPISTADSFINILDHNIAGGVGLAPQSVTGRWDKTNFSSGRGALLAEDMHIRPIQNWFARDYALPIRKRFHELAILRRRLKSVTLANYLANPRKYGRFEAIGNGREMLDPEAETGAAAGRIRSGLSHLKLECARRNLHWVRVLRQRALEEGVTRALGLVLDFSKGQGGQVQKPAAGQDEQDPADRRREPQPKKKEGKR